MKIIISGGGTGGHVFPAIAIADALKQLDPATEILFVGAQGKLEMEKVPKAGYPIKGLKISGFQRKLTVKNFINLFHLVGSLWKARKIVRNFQPDVVVGVGGYASGPTLEMAHRQGIPILVQEQNSYAGVTNKLLAKKAAKVCVAYPKMERFFPKEVIQLTGNPVRKDLQSLDHLRMDGIKHFGLDPTKKTILIVGGSLGAKTLNIAMRFNTESIEKLKSIQILWQAGKLYIEAYKKCETAQLPNVKIRAFLDRMDLAYAAADVVIARAGAGTISELCLVGKPTVLIPSPNVAEDHQTENAKALVEAQAAIMVKDSDATLEMLPKAIHILRNDTKRRQLSQQIKTLARPDAARDIAQAVRELASKGSY
ncbi:MAG: undecaprenyldiphospho-muramoylpentapeptide beta-N-acetylglucosaminyltransferase [Bacteroidota bacterium]